MPRRMKELMVGLKEEDFKVKYALTCPVPLTFVIFFLVPSVLHLKNPPDDKNDFIIYRNMYLL